ncbi:MAG: hypothetical protein EAX81_06705 [Candidatus Thorarchaeota archaeon]|nr:hypothetical protein [Candidatus Thorarchaeota archaeon]
MAEGSERIIKPPVEEFEAGRVFRPLSTLRHKKWLKSILTSVALYAVFLFSFFGPPLITILVFEFIPFNLFFVKEGWFVGSLVYWGLTPFWLIPVLIWAHFYVKNIEYSVVGWEGDAMPEIYQKKGIITITKKFVPFKNITHVKSRVGVFDRLFGIGTLKIETAGKSGGIQPTGILTLILSRLFSQSSEESIEGIAFYEELKQFILKELRSFGDRELKRGTEGKIFTRQTLRAFQELRDVLKESKGGNQ